MIYSSTRNKNITASPAKAIIDGIAPDGGLYSPLEFPHIDIKGDGLINKSYEDLAYYIMSKFFTDFTKSELTACIHKAYSDKFIPGAIAPLVSHNGVHFLELYHGPTLAFKDMALTILPHLVKCALSIEGINKKIVILTATSGDTGKAALEGFANVEATEVIVFFPENGVSEIQKLQMLTQEGANTHVVSINGNFDDAQRGVKDIFADKELAKKLSNEGYLLSSANSINIGRLVPQIVYYFHSYLTLVRDKKLQMNGKINLVIPTGNFGNILAAYYAKKMGLPVNKLICASNENNVLTDFLKTGIYDSNRTLELTSSPSMDILISSNLERFLFEISNQNAEIIKDLMASLNKYGKYEISEAMKNNLGDFYGSFSKESEVKVAISETYNSANYLIDTHTAVAYSVYKKYLEETLDATPTIVVATASPYKFSKSVCEALELPIDGLNDFEISEQLFNKTKYPVPQNLAELKHKKILHNININKQEMQSTLEQLLKVGEQEWLK